MPSAEAIAAATQMYAEILGRAPDAGGLEAFANAIDSGSDMGSLAQSMAGSQEAQNNANSGQGPSQQQVQNAVNNIASDPGGFVQQAQTGQGMRDYVTALYQNILGRAPDAKGLQDNIDAIMSGRISPEALASSFAGSPEAQTNNIPASQEQAAAAGLSQTPGQNLSPAQYNAAAVGLTNLNPQQTQQLYDLKTTNPTEYYSKLATEVGNELYGRYTTNQNYDQLYNQLQSLKDVAPQAYYEAQLKFLGQQTGWQLGQNTPGRIAPVQEQINSIAQQAQAAGVDVNQVISSAAQAAKQQNQDRIASEAPSGIGGAFAHLDSVVNHNVPGGWVTVALAAAAATGVYFSPEIMAALAEGGGATTLTEAGLTQSQIAQMAGTFGGEAFQIPAVAEAATQAAMATASEAASTAIGQALPYTEAFDAINLASQGLSEAAITQNLAATGLNPLMAADIAGLASQGLSEAAINQVLQYSYSAAELAPLGLESLQQTTPGLLEQLGQYANQGLDALKGLPWGTIAAGVAAGILAPSILKQLTPATPAAPVQPTYGPLGPVQFGTGQTLNFGGVNQNFLKPADFSGFGTQTGQPALDVNEFTRNYMGQPKNAEISQGANAQTAQYVPVPFQPKTAADYTPQKIFGPSGQPGAPVAPVVAPNATPNLMPTPTPVNTVSGVPTNTVAAVVPTPYAPVTQPLIGGQAGVGPEWTWPTATTPVVPTA